ncbi:MAG: hypothetical protein QG670_1189 [Thermoproteota archaeon]|nr:hypothetical protein [Thermoproteota archaeon]
MAWGITGGGDRLVETFEVMKEIRRQYDEDEVDMKVYLSKAGEQVANYYKLTDDLKTTFNRVSVEVNSNSPFLVGALQRGEFEFLLIAPATSNTVAKIVVGIADTLLSNATIQALKAFVPVYIMPTDYREGMAITRLPDGHEMKLRIRKEDADNSRKLVSMEGVMVLEKTEDIFKVFKRYFGLGT